MSTKGIKVFLASLMAVLVFQISVFAAVSVSNRTGTIKITLPDGTELIVKADEDIPEIPDGATIEIISGTAEISTDGESFVTVVVGDSSTQISSGESVSAGFDADTSETFITPETEADETGVGNEETAKDISPIY